jgi:hypothetical protein
MVSAASKVVICRQFELQNRYTKVQLARPLKPTYPHRRERRFRRAEPDTLKIGNPEIAHPRARAVMRIEIIIMKIIEGAFFAGLIGCAAVVVISWVSILKEGFTKDAPK